MTCLASALAQALLQVLCCTTNVILQLEEEKSRVLNRQFLVNTNIDLLTNYICILQTARASVGVFAFRRCCTAYYYNGSLWNEHPQNCPFPWGIWTWLLGPSQFFNPNGISIGSEVFAQLTVVFRYFTMGHHFLPKYPLQLGIILFPCSIYSQNTNAANCHHVNLFCSVLVENQKYSRISAYCINTDNH